MGKGSSRASAAVIGVGNEFRGDDAVGIVAARELRRILPDQTPVIELSGEGASLIEAFGAADFIVIIDAVRSGAPPGTIHRIDPRTENIPSFFKPGSSHAFGVSEAIETAKLLGRLPSRVILFGIEGESFDPGETLSRFVRRSLPSLVDLILRELNTPASPH